MAQHGGQAAAADPREGGSGAESLSVQEILDLYKQPINEEQAWAVCYQCCGSLLEGRGAGGKRRRLAGASDIRIRRDGTVITRWEPGSSSDAQCTETEVIVSLGIIIYKALDYGLKDNEERELSPPLERLIDQMTNIEETDGSNDEGYDALDEEDEDHEVIEERGFRHSYKNVMKLCASHLPTPSDAPTHYQAVCRALYAEAMELHMFLTKIKSAKESLRKIQEMEKDRTDRGGADLDDLQTADWALFWVQVMRDLRNGVKLKKVQERQYNLLPTEYELTPYEMLMDDIRFKRYTLRKVTVQGDIPPRLKKSAHEIILDFIRSRPPLNPVSARKLKPTPPRPRSLHERILEEIKAERKLRPVSPDEIRRSKLVIRPLSMSYSFDLSDVSIPEVSRPISVADRPVLNGDVMQPPQVISRPKQVPVQRKKLLKAPALAEFDSSESEEDLVQKAKSSSSSISNSQLEDTSPEAAPGRKTPPKFLPISSTPQPERRQAPQRRHSIEKETPTNVRQFLPPSRQSSRSLEEFCYPVECLALTVEEVMHIRQVLVKAELEKFQQYKDVYNALKKGKLCFCCRTKRFSLFTWSYTCQFCKRPVCSQCCKKMRLPSKPYSTLPIFSLGPSTLQRGESFLRPEKPSTSHHRPMKSLPKLPSKSKSTEKSDDELQFPKELMEDWSAMEVCVDCKKFILEIITSSRHSLTIANKRARLKRKTQSFYMASTGSSEFRPRERTINEI
ncbi:spire homolog 1 isoform X3 [Pelobates cultripes]|uniref:Spire homolog 1 isoform X3 n=1 Tax=Pelobates cultripes TaxID=61616 RepID=A0AAD1W628_PELCU|nr:spire homolog 1 isoform X3 [Pelobates cultripes]CAH2284734.1 spire homolog 1 isoform X3 [Pelobates cultripes]CAH2284737.1 spire homolog 1 isoform X3 [Pelobates cultripes]